jgi:hypothetical protein
MISDDDELERAVQAEGMQLESDSATTVQNLASQIEEWTLLLRFVTSGSDNTVNIAQLHKNIFLLIQKSDDKFAAKTINGTLIDSATDFPSGENYQAQFKTQETKNQFVVSHTVYSSKSIDSIKRTNTALLELLRANNVFLDLSATGSLFEVVLGPIFGVHPDHTSKKQIHHDMSKLFMVHKQWSDPLPQLHADAKANLTFEDTLPPFQLRTRRIRREIDGAEFSAKATVFVCASEHRQFWEHLLVEGMSEGWLTPIGRFYLLLREDNSAALQSAICYHNRVLASMKAVVITGITDYAMDCGVRPPHSAEERPTLREHIHNNGGFVTIISSHEDSKWIGITTDVEAAKRFVNTGLRDLCAEVYDDGTAPVAAAPIRPTRQDRAGRSSRSQHSRQSHASRSALLEKQGSSWADIARTNDTESSTLHSESNIARRPPRNNAFQSKVRFDIEVIHLTQPETRPPAQDNETAFTAITQDYLDDMESRIHARFQDELGSRLSDLSSPHDSQSRQAEFQTSVAKQITQQNEQIQLTMGTMQTMMQAMQKLVQDVTSRRSNSPTPSSSSQASFQDANEGDPLPQQYNPASPLRNNLPTQDDRQDYASAITQPDDTNIVPFDWTTTATKRSAPAQKGESPAAKRSTGGRSDGTARGRGRGRGRGRAIRDDHRTLRSDHRSLRKNLGNSYGPLETMSDAQSSSGSI